MTEEMPEYNTVLIHKNILSNLNNLENKAASLARAGNHSKAYDLMVDGLRRAKQELSKESLTVEDSLNKINIKPTEGLVSHVSRKLKGRKLLHAKSDGEYLQLWTKAEHITILM